VFECKLVSWGKVPELEAFGIHNEFVVFNNPRPESDPGRIDCAAERARIPVSMNWTLVVQTKLSRATVQLINPQSVDDPIAKSPSVTVGSVGRTSPPCALIF